MKQYILDNQKQRYESVYFRQPETKIWISIFKTIRNKDMKQYILDNQKQRNETV